MAAGINDLRWLSTLGSRSRPEGGTEPLLLLQLPAARRQAMPLEKGHGSSPTAIALTRPPSESTASAVRVLLSGTGAALT